jgi:hypothetical protein
VRVLQYFKTVRYQYESITFYSYKSADFNCTILKFNDTYILLGHKYECNVPDIIGEKDSYLYPHTISVNKKILTEALQRLNVVSSASYNNRSKMTIQESSIILECDDSFNLDYQLGKGVKVNARGNETISCEVNSKLVGKQIYIAVNSILKVLPLFEEEYLNIHIPEDLGENSIFTITNESKTKMYLFYYDNL